MCTQSLQRRPKKGIWKIILVSAVLFVVGLLGIGAAITHYYKSSYPRKYTEFVEKYAQQNELPEELVYAVIRTESDFQPLVESVDDARGLMQITPQTFDWIKSKNSEWEHLEFDSLFDEETNIAFGTFLLRQLLDEFRTLDNAIGAYHAGWGSMKKWLKDPAYSPDGENIDPDAIPFDDTRAYVKKIKETMEIYRKLYYNTRQEDR